MARPENRKPTSFDVAKLAGVSRSAVSRAYTPGAHISDETRKKVMEAASELGYRVNSLARGLQQEHSGIVGLVASRLDTPLRSRQVRLLSEALIREGFKPMLITAERPDDVSSLIEILLGYSIAGIIVTSDSPPRALIEECGRLRLPVVLVNRAGVSNWGDRVVADNQGGGQLAFDVLFAAGARRMACMMPEKETYSVSGRCKAFVAAAAAKDVPCQILHVADQSYEDARHAMRNVDPDILKGADAVFCATDLIALGALDALRVDLGLRVPQDIQLLGFDDIEQASWGSYNLSTIRQDVAEQTDTVLRLLTERIADSSLPNRVEKQNLVSILRDTTRNPG